MPDLSNNLRLGKDGKLFCEDGQDADEYIRKSTLAKKKLPIAVVILSREDFLTLCRQAWEHKWLIQAA